MTPYRVPDEYDEWLRSVDDRFSAEERRVEKARYADHLCLSRVVPSYAERGFGGTSRADENLPVERGLEGLAEREPGVKARPAYALPGHLLREEEEAA